MNTSSPSLNFATRMVWESNIGPSLYIYHGPSCWEGAYVRTNAHEKDSLISGRILFRDVHQHVTKPDEGELKLQGSWVEVRGGGRGTCEFVITKDTGHVTPTTQTGKDDTGYSLKGFFVKEGSSKEAKPKAWNGVKYLTGDQAVMMAALPFQIRWVESMNTQDWRQCGQLYTEDAYFCGYNGGGPGVHVVKKGQHEVRDWWRTVVCEMTLCNMRASSPKIAVLGDDEISAAYDWFSFGSQKEPESMAFTGSILCELWVRRGGAWMVQRDVVQAGCRVVD
eukprot:g7685.t1